MSVKLAHFQRESTLLLMEVSQNIFDRQVKLEALLNETLAGPLKHDAEVLAIVTSLMQILTDWKTEMKIYVARSPLLTENGLQ